MGALGYALQALLNMLSEAMRALVSVVYGFNAMLQRWKQKRATERFWASLERDARRLDMQRAKQARQIAKEFRKTSNSRLYWR